MVRPARLVMRSLVEEGVSSAKQRFPARTDVIDALAASSEAFRDLCEELATAEAALASVDRSDEAIRAERRLEWLSYVRSALSAIEAELRRMNVVPIERRGPKPPVV
jgi:hypothetical protein